MNTILQGDCLQVLPTLDDNSVDAIVTDPPYELGFMNKGWDSSGIAYNVELWRECLRVLKPGGHLLSFGGSRTYHRMACAIEDAGFEIRDQIQWIYGSGFPKSQNIGKAIDKAAGVEREVVGVKRAGYGNRNGKTDAEGSVFLNSLPEELKRVDITKGDSEWEGWGSALKPAHEPIVLARKPLSEKTIAANVLKWGTGGINIDGCRVGTNDSIKSRTIPDIRGGNLMNHKGNKEELGSFKQNPLGRFPANLIHDGSDEVVKGFPQTTSGSAGVGSSTKVGGMFGSGNPVTSEHRPASSGSAARFFYCAKASKAERNMGCEGLEERVAGSMVGNTKENTQRLAGDGVTPVKQVFGRNNHPTVKPLALMRYLCRLITPPNGIVLDPFAGSGSTLIAAKQEGFNYIGIEMESEYIEIINARLSVSDDRQQTIFEGV